MHPCSVRSILLAMFLLPWSGRASGASSSEYAKNEIVFLDEPFEYRHYSGTANMGWVKFTIQGCHRGVRICLHWRYVGLQDSGIPGRTEGGDSQEEVDQLRGVPPYCPRRGVLFETQTRGPTTSAG